MADLPESVTMSTSGSADAAPRPACIWRERRHVRSVVISRHSKPLTLSVGTGRERMSRLLIAYTVQLSIGTTHVGGVRLEWEGYPQCALYNGQGGPNDHSGLPAKPFLHCLNGHDCRGD
jgi:hypothetical protein